MTTFSPALTVAREDAELALYVQTDVIEAYLSAGHLHADDYPAAEFLAVIRAISEAADQLHAIAMGRASEWSVARDQLRWALEQTNALDLPLDVRVPLADATIRTERILAAIERERESRRGKA